MLFLRRASLRNPSNYHFQTEANVPQQGRDFSRNRLLLLLLLRRLRPRPLQRLRLPLHLLLRCYRCQILTPWALLL